MTSIGCDIHNIRNSFYPDINQLRDLRYLKIFAHFLNIVFDEKHYLQYGVKHYAGIYFVKVS